MKLNHQISQPSRILLVRLSAIGDIVMASGLPSLLKQRWPNAKIDWLCQPECMSLLENHPDINKVVTWDRKQWNDALSHGRLIKLAQLKNQFKRDCRAIGYDLAIDLQGLLKSALLTRWSGASYRLGLGRAEGAHFLYHSWLARVKPAQAPLGSEYRHLASHLGINFSRYPIQVNFNQSCVASANKILGQNGVTLPYLVFCPFTTRPQKHWFNDHWVQLQQLLQQDTGLPIVVLGGPADREEAHRLTQSSGMINLAGKTNLLEAASIIAGSQGMVGVDTGLTHMGHAASVPTLCLFGSTCPYLDPGNPRGEIIYLNLDCAPCRRRPTCNGRFDCMRQITPQQVARQLQQLIQRPAPSTDW